LGVSSELLLSTSSCLSLLVPLCCEDEYMVTRVGSDAVEWAGKR
jgi:hypothetical protein